MERRVAASVNALISTSKLWFSFYSKVSIKVLFRRFPEGPNYGPFPHEKEVILGGFLPIIRNVWSKSSWVEQYLPYKTSPLGKSSFPTEIRKSSNVRPGGTRRENPDAIFSRDQNRLNQN